MKLIKFSCKAALYRRQYSVQYWFKWCRYQAQFSSDFVLIQLLNINSFLNLFKHLKCFCTGSNLKVLILKTVLTIIDYYTLHGVSCHNFTACYSLSAKLKIKQLLDFLKKLRVVLFKQKLLVSGGCYVLYYC